jgi:hypothetical protein
MARIPCSYGQVASELPNFRLVIMVEPEIGDAEISLL